MSRDRNDQNRNVLWPKRLRPKRLRQNRPDRKVVYPAPATFFRRKAGMKINEMHDIYVSYSPVFKSAQQAIEQVS